MSKWEKIKLKQLTTKIGSGATPKGGQEAYHDFGISLIRSQNVLDFEFSNSGLAFIDQDQAEKLSNVVVEDDDILLNITGDSVARVCKVPSNILPARVNQHVSIIRADNQKLNSDFLLYFLLNPIFKRHLLRLASDGATRNALTKANLENLLIPVPLLDEQKSIAGVLSCLDRKIENLRKQNETLERIAQTLFKHWFIDFEFPNEDGKPYKSSGGEMERSELGEIPVDWRVHKLGDFVKKSNTGADAIQKAPIVEKNTGIRCIRVGDLTNKRLFEDWGYCEITHKNFEQYRLRQNDIVVTRTSALGLNLLIMRDLPAVFNNGLIRLRLYESVSQFLIYSFLQSDRFKEHIKKITYETSTRPNMQINYLLDFLVLEVNKNIEKEFSTLVSQTLSKIDANKRQIQILTATRDVLLPKLMSGKLRITG